jgi:hypothetical protein
MEERKERSTKHTKKEELKVRDYMDMFTELMGLVGENYLMGFRLGLSLWEGNLKIISSQVEQSLAMQDKYTTVMKELFGRFPFPTEAFSFWAGESKSTTNPVEKMMALQKDYFNLLINTSDRFMKEAL